jgi:hypothetical protein
MMAYSLWDKCDRLRALVAAAIFCACVGCGKRDPWSPVQIAGKVTYEDGTAIPVSGLKLYFVPQTPPIDGKIFPRQGIVVVGSDGTFDTATTYKYGDGVIPGKHKVAAVAYAQDGRRLSPDIPAIYTKASSTPLEIDTADSPLHIKIRKP